METTIKKPKIDAIYPLTAMQQGLLFHHLTEGEDQGFLTVQCVIDGPLDIALFKQAWKAVSKRHEVMRTSVHWKNVERPVLLVRPEKEIQWSFLDWRDQPATEQNRSLEAYKKERKDLGVAFEENPLSRISVIQKESDSYYFVWECHHLLLDGWSSTIILKDAFAYYASLSSGVSPQLPTIPNYTSYRNWLKTNTLTGAADFWKTTFEDFTKASLFQQNTAQSLGKTPTSYTNKFTVQTSEDLKSLAKHYKVTLNTLFQGIWSLALAKCFNTKDVTFGTTVSGRSIPFPNIERMAGMFANVLPVRTLFDISHSFQFCLQQLQSQQQGARNYEYCKIDEIVSWANVPEDQPLFDNLFVFENFPWENISSGDLTVSSFESGITTTYPLTVIFKIEDCIQYDLLVNTAVIPTAIIEWFLNVIPTIAVTLLLNKDTSVNDALQQIPIIPSALSRKRILDDLQVQEDFEKKETTYIAPRNKVELTLVEIWEQLFGINYISITDSFFHLGGKSLLSVKMFALIEEKLGVKLPPTTLLESPTIQALAEVITTKGNTDTVAWKYLVPIKTKGEKTPLFCIHAGGGHVFFYKSLADAIDIQRPVYALQPVGIFGEDNMHQSIEDMARDYADEISLVQPEGTLNIVVYCFSTAVGLEMVSYLKSKGRETHLIVADTIAEHRLLFDKERLLIRVTAFLKRFFSNPFKALYAMIGFRVMFYLKPIRVRLFGNEAEKNTEKMRLHLVDLFNAYTWDSKIDNVSLILTEKGDDHYNHEIVRSWKPLVLGEIIVKTTKGQHATFFEDPDVLHTAQAMDQVIIES